MWGARRVTRGVRVTQRTQLPCNVITWQYFLLHLKIVLIDWYTLATISVQPPCAKCGRPHFILQKYSFHVNNQPPNYRVAVAHQPVLSATHSTLRPYRQPCRPCLFGPIFSYGMWVWVLTENYFSSNCRVASAVDKE